MTAPLRRRVVDSILVWQHRVQKIAAPAQLALLAATLAFTIAPYLHWRGVHPRLAVPLVFAAVGALVLAAAWVYVKLLNAHVAEHRANALHNPYMRWALTPWEHAQWLMQIIPLYRTLAAHVDATGGDASELRAAIEWMERVADQGYIPKDDYPPQLRHHYMERDGHPL